jgi:alkylhydroperoxidase family enzyme
MSLINMVQPEEATGELEQIYAEIKHAFGSVPNVLKVWSASPLLLKQQWEFIAYSMKHPNLSAVLLTCIRLMVSRGNHCEYCVEIRLTT